MNKEMDTYKEMAKWPRVAATALESSLHKSRTLACESCLARGWEELWRGDTGNNGRFAWQKKQGARRSVTRGRGGRPGSPHSENLFLLLHSRASDLVNQPVPIQENRAS